MATRAFLLSLTHHAPGRALRAGLGCHCGREELELQLLPGLGNEHMERLVGMIDSIGFHIKLETKLFW